mgnify:CR=1 FL=1
MSVKACRGRVCLEEFGRRPEGQGHGGRMEGLGPAGKAAVTHGTAV